MSKVVVFAGTTEGRKLCEFLSGNGIETLMCVATSYGTQPITPGVNLEISVGRLTSSEMEELFEKSGCGLIVDATHPYAAQVSLNIKTAAKKKGTEAIRLLRASSDLDYSGLINLSTIREAAEYLGKTNWRTLLTIGSKELEEFTKLEGFQSRVFSRVLPSAKVLEGCAKLGFKGSQIIGMQGPFPHEINVATIKMLRIDCLVTKDSGETGGFPQKLSAAKETGIKLIVIARPNQETGLSLEQTKAFVLERFPDKSKAFPRFPVFMSLENQRILVVGGGKIAQRRVEILLKFGAKITVISPKVTAELAQLEKTNQLEIKLKEYEKADITAQKLVLAATDDREVNRQIGQDAKSQGILVSVADKKEESTFYFPGIVMEKGLVAGIVSVNSDHGKVKQAKAELTKNWKEALE